MDKFYNWLQHKKGVISSHELSYVPEDEFVVHDNGVIYFGKKCTFESFPKILMIGYMIEYLIEKEVVWSLLYTVQYSIEDIYSYLVEKIEEIK
jgi:hypothetical protein